MFVDLADNLKRKKTTRDIDEMQRGERGDSGNGTKRDQIWISTDWEKGNGVRNRAGRWSRWVGTVDLSRRERSHRAGTLWVLWPGPNTTGAAA